MVARIFDRYTGRVLLVGSMVGIRGVFGSTVVLDRRMVRAAYVRTCLRSIISLKTAIYRPKRCDEDMIHRVPQVIGSSNRGTHLPLSLVSLLASQ